MYSKKFFQVAIKIIFIGFVACSKVSDSDSDFISTQDTDTTRQSLQPIDPVNNKKDPNLDALIELLDAEIDSSEFKQEFSDLLNQLKKELADNNLSKKTIHNISEFECGEDHPEYTEQHCKYIKFKKSTLLGKVKHHFIAKNYPYEELLFEEKRKMMLKNSITMDKDNSDTEIYTNDFYDEITNSENTTTYELPGNPDYKISVIEAFNHSWGKKLKTYNYSIIDTKDNKVAGVLKIGQTDSDHWKLGDFILDEKYRGKKLATPFMKTALSIIEEKEHVFANNRKIDFYTNDIINNTACEHIYKKLFRKFDKYGNGPGDLSFEIQNTDFDKLKITDLKETNLSADKKSEINKNNQLTEQFSLECIINSFASEIENIKKDKKIMDEYNSNKDFSTMITSRINRRKIAIKIKMEKNNDENKDLLKRLDEISLK